MNDILADIYEKAIADVQTSLSKYIEEQLMPAKHYRYGGSTAGRVLQCPAWLKLADCLPDKPDGASPDADRGTLLHDCMEDLLNNPDLSPQDCLNREYNGQVVTQEDIDEAITPALNAYLDFADERGIEIELPEVEVRIPKRYDMGGTSDVIAANEDTVFIIDWKFGYYGVNAVENPQGLFYAACASVDHEMKSLFERREKLCIVIIQPKADAILSAWDTDIHRLHVFMDEYAEAVRDTESAKPLPQTGPYCKFCPAMAICPAKTGQARKALMLDPDSDDARGLSDALDLADEVIEWAQSVKKLAHEQAELGLKIDGYKLVDKRATRKWTNEAAVLEKLRKAKKIKLDEATDTKLKSPAQLEKLCKKKEIDFEQYAAYIESVSSGTTLTTDDDPRPEAFNHAAFKAAIDATE